MPTTMDAKRLSSGNGWYTNEDLKPGTFIMLTEYAGQNAPGDFLEVVEYTGTNMIRVKSSLGNNRRFWFRRFVDKHSQTFRISDNHDGILPYNRKCLFQKLR